MTVRHLYGWTIAIVSAFGVWAFCLFSPPQTWSVLEKLKSPPTSAPTRTGPFDGDGYDELSAWLRRNLDDPDFERVTWWSWRSLKPAIEAQRKRVSDVDTAVQITRDLPEYACRIKYRTRNKFGAKELRDETFGVFRGKIKPLADVDSLALKELFPD